MALPREPRQKMINIMYLVLTAILALNVSNEVINAFKVVDRSLVISSDNIGAANNTLYKSLEEKLKESQSAEKAKIWQPKAIEAQRLSAEMDAYLNSLKAELKKEADVKMVDKDGVQVESYKEDNLEAATRLFDKQGKGKELDAKLRQYREAMLNIDPAIRKEFEKTLPIDITLPSKKKDFTQTYFHMTPTVAALTMLSKFQNNVKNAENQVVTYAHNQIGAVKFIYDQFAALVGQTSNYVMPGQEITITAGVGAYSTAAQPQISINGAGVPVGANGTAEYRFKPNGAGSHNVPVSVTYTKPDGTKESKTFNVEYTVGTPGGAAVMLDKMNVFYIGVDNPVTISSGTGWDKTNASFSGSGSMSGSQGKRVVRVTGGTTATINVNADGKSSTFQFRIKRIPDPTFKVGPSAGGRIQSVVFKNQQFCRADLENFDFDARFSVVGATVYFSGANFLPVQIATLNGNNLGSLPQLSKCIPGTSVTFDNVKVQGPDGVVRTIQGPGFILQ
ncbi:MAG: gliding motility protein GldM [Chitinophagaceae bacterium]|nr:gliding motility protein GldM [Chitinophagaceae bacterium]